MSKHKVSAKVRAVIELLTVEFPTTFSFDRVRKPLMVGIDRAILQVHPELDPRNLGAALGAYTRSVAYLRGLVAAGAMRVDLAGFAVEPVSPEIAAKGVVRLAEIRANRPPQKAPAPYLDRGAGASHPAGMAGSSAREPPPTTVPPAYPTAPRSGGTSLAGLRAAAAERRARAQTPRSAAEAAIDLKTAGGTS